MNVWEAVALGVVQGLAEFLPVSSSGHLVVGQFLLGIELPGVDFEIAVHFATLASVLVAYRNRVGALVRGSLRADAAAWRYFALTALASVPAATVYFLFGDVVEAAFETPAAAGVAFLATGGALWSARAALRRGARGRARGAGRDRDGNGSGGGLPNGSRPDGRTDFRGVRSREPGPFSGAPGPGAALLIGTAQAFALFPGISRSGSTVVAALWLGMESDDAAEFSFLISVPAIGGAALLRLFGDGTEASGPGAVPLALGAVAAAATGLLAIKVFLAVLRARSFHRFAPYPWALGLLFLAYLWMG